MRLFIEPTEPLLFRTGRPFDAGENNFAESIFPPTPETLQGAVRAAIATHWKPNLGIAEAFNDPELTDLIGVYAKYERFRVASIALGRRKASQQVELLYPMPANILQEEDGNKRQVRLIPRTAEQSIQTNLLDNMQLLYPHLSLSDIQGKLEPMRGWLTEQGLYTALWTNKDIAKDDIIHDSEIYTRELRMGLGMNNQKKTTEEGLLYSVEMIRMNHKVNWPYTYGFVVDVRIATSADTKSTAPESYIEGEEAQKELHLPNYGWITLGGERRAAYFEVIKPAPATQTITASSQKAGTLLYLASPAAFDGSWKPEQWPQTSAKLLAAAIPRYQPIGGWLLNPGNSGGENKSTHRCVPAGSVYFFDAPVSLDQPLTNYGWQIGYGITYTGEWKQ